MGSSRLWGCRSELSGRGERSERSVRERAERQGPSGASGASGASGREKVNGSSSVSTCHGLSNESGGSRFREAGGTVARVARVVVTRRNEALRPSRKGHETNHTALGIVAIIELWLDDDPPRRAEHLSSLVDLDPSYFCPNVTSEHHSILLVFES
jgi:hypothetical protein